MKSFIDLLLNDSVLFLIAITIIVLIVLIIICILLLKKRYDLDSNDNKLEIKSNNALAELSELTKETSSVAQSVENLNSRNEDNIDKNLTTEDDKIDLEAMLSKMEATLNEKEQAIVNFEQEQEEKAIISYEELKKAVSQNNNMEVTKVESLEPKLPVQEIDKSIELDHKDKSFKNTDFISPIFGKMDNNYDYPKIEEFAEQRTVLKKTTNENLAFAKHSEDKNEAFLDSLKQFRKNLE